MIPEGNPNESILAPVTPMPETPELDAGDDAEQARAVQLLDVGIANACFDIGAVQRRIRAQWREPDHRQVLRAFASCGPCLQIA
jgi:hypothetical protein